jgi:hypothetical protein
VFHSSILGLYLSDIKPSLYSGIRLISFLIT